LSMREGSYIVGLDVGTTKICTIVGRLREDDGGPAFSQEDSGVEILAVGTYPSLGLRKGIVVDMDATILSIRESVKKAEKISGREIHDVYVGISGGHIKSFRSSGAVGIKEGDISSKDIQRVMESAKAVYVPLDREVLHTIPVEYIVDGESGIMNPIGMRGVRLEAHVQIITGSVTSVQNLLKCCERAGLHVIDIVLEPLASAMAVLTMEEKEYGVVLVDIGGGTTDIALFKNNTFMDTSVLGIGGNHFTNDIAVGLRLPVIEAERVKKSFGTAVYSEEYDAEDVAIMVANREEKTIPRRYITEIIHPRCEELFYLIKQEMGKMSAYDLASYGVVLTGGASMVHGIERVSEAILSLPVRIGMPEGMTDIVKSPIYSTAVGLLLYARENLPDTIGSMDLFTHILNTMKGWIKGIFR